MSQLVKIQQWEFSLVQRRETRFPPCWPPLREPVKYSPYVKILCFLKQRMDRLPVTFLSSSPHIPPPDLLETLPISPNQPNSDPVLFKLFLLDSFNQNLNDKDKTQLLRFIVGFFSFFLKNHPIWTIYKTTF